MSSSDTSHLLDDEPAPDTVAFDIGEVLVDESRVYAVWAELIGVSPLAFGAVLGAAIVQGAPLRDVFAHLAPNVAWESQLEEHEARLGGLTGADLYTDARACLDELAGHGFRVLIAGNQPARRTEQLTALGLAADGIITSEELGAEKPDAAFFTALMRWADVDDPARILYVGDRVDNDVDAAMAAGMRSCWLRRGPWGQLQLLADGVEPDLVLEGLGELPTLLATWRDG